MRSKTQPRAGDNDAADIIKTGTETQESFIVVCQVGTYNFGIIVDRVFDTEEIVVKPVAPILRDVSLFSGNTILGDGSVIMILDPNGIAMATGEVSAGETESDDQVERAETGVGERVALLLFHAGGDTPKAVPLALVARLEEIEGENVEYSNGQAMVQYRDQLMPLVMLSEADEIKSEGRQPVIVFSDQDRSMGLVVNEIMDIVEDTLDVELPSRSENGVLGSAIIAEKATDIIDVGYFLSKAFDDWFRSPESSVAGVARLRPAGAAGRRQPIFPQSADAPVVGRGLCGHDGRKRRCGHATLRVGTTV